MKQNQHDTCTTQCCLCARFTLTSWSPNRESPTASASQPMVHAVLLLLLLLLMLRLLLSPALICLSIAAQ